MEIKKKSVYANDTIIVWYSNMQVFGILSSSTENVI